LTPWNQPLIHRLSDQASAAEVGDWLIDELRGHFGLTPNEQRERQLAADLTKWWDEATST
jgi:hypothetical protein